MVKGSNLLGLSFSDRNGMEFALERIFLLTHNFLRLFTDVEYIVLNYEKSNELPQAEATPILH